MDSLVEIGTSSRANSRRASAVPIFCNLQSCHLSRSSPGLWWQVTSLDGFLPPHSRNGAGLVPTGSISGQALGYSRRKKKSFSKTYLTSSKLARFSIFLFFMNSLNPQAHFLHLTFFKYFLIKLKTYSNFY